MFLKHGVLIHGLVWQFNLESFQEACFLIDAITLKQIVIQSQWKTLLSSVLFECRNGHILDCLDCKIVLTLS